MNSSYFWFGTPADDYQVDHSLRFRGAQYLRRVQADQQTYTADQTWSCWLKVPFTAPVVNSSVWQYQGNWFSFNFPDTLNNVRIDLSGTVNDFSDFVCRDTGAWYHFVISNDASTNQTNVWCNGELRETIAANFTTGAPSSNLCVGGQTPDGAARFFEGYMSEVYFIDGQALQPTDFGEYNSAGVWIPKLATLPGGPTLNGQVYSDEVFLSTSTTTVDFNTTTKITNPGANPTSFAFNGNLNDKSSTVDALTGWVWRPKNLTAQTSFRVYLGDHSGTTETFYVNSTEVVPEAQYASPQWVDVGASLTFPVTITNFASKGGNYNGSGRAGGYISAIEVDGEILLDPAMYSADLTSPSGFDANGPGRAFDGNTSTQASALLGGSTNPLTFAPTSEISYTQLEVFCTASAMNIAIGGTTVTSNGGWVTVESAAGTISATRPLTITPTNANTAVLSAVQINGNQILVDGINAAYGANGFYLDFDPDHIVFDGTDGFGDWVVEDQSGNGNNFTAEGDFDFNRVSGPPGRYSSGLTVPGGWQAVAPASAAFNGEERPGANSNTSGAQATWAPNPPVTFSQSFEVLGVTQDWSYNGTTGTMGSPFQYYTIATGAGEISATTPFVFGNGTSWANMQAVKIDGVILVEGAGVDYDVMDDSPTQNFSTLNPLIGPSPSAVAGPQVIEPANAMLQAGPDQTGADGFVNSTIFQTDRDVYVECNVQDVQNQIEIGFLEEGARFGGGVVTTSGGFFGFNQSSQVWTLNADGTQTFIALDATNQTFGFHVDVSAGEIDVYHNGAVIGTSTGWTFTEPRTFAVGTNGGSNVLTMSWNYGQQPFIQRPAALGNDTELQTNNLPADDVTAGTSGFRALTASGAQILAVSQGTSNAGTNWDPTIQTGFTSGLWWIKDINPANTNQHQLLDSVRGGTSAINCPGLTTQPYVTPTGNSVGWCWEASDTWASTDPDVTAGTLASSGRRNLQTGFSIISYTGDGNQGATVAHGLDRAPTFAIFKNTSINTNNIVVGSDASSWDQVMFLNQSLAREPSTVGYFASPPNNTVFNLGAFGNTNDDGGSLVAYAWYDVPGYSAFGLYQGNLDADGPFVYLGFRPAFVLTKALTMDNWYIQDSTINTFNPVDNWLVTNNTNGQGTTLNMDFLSNGFKIRTAASEWNGNRQYLYAAFAQYPFGGNNVDPANAR